MGCHSSQLKETKETNVDSNILLSVLYVWVGQIVFLVHSSLDRSLSVFASLPDCL